jgi:hypothetical protein
MKPNPTKEFMEKHVKGTVYNPPYEVPPTEEQKAVIGLLRKSYLHTGPIPSGCVVSSHTFFWGRADLIYSVTAQVVHGKNAKAKKLQKFKKIFIELGSWIHSATHEEIIASGVFTITKDPNYVQPTGTDSTAADH